MMHLVGMNYEINLQTLRPRILAAVRRRVEIREIPNAFKPALDQPVKTNTHTQQSRCAHGGGAAAVTSVPSVISGAVC